MKLFFKIFGCLILTGLVACYLCFLFLLPNKLDLNTYINDIKTLAHENSDFDVDIEGLKLYTTPLLSIGVKANGVKVLYKDGSDLLKLDNADIKIAPLSIFLLTVKSPSIIIESPEITLDVEGGKQLKLLTVIEDMVNKNIKLEEEKTEEENQFFNPNWIKIKLSNILVKNYSLTIKDDLTKHDLKIKGDELFAYYDGHKVKVKGGLDVENNNKKNITANADILFYIPKVEEEKTDDDKAVALSFPYINPVKEFEKINPKATVDTKIKIRQKAGKMWSKGYINIDDMSAKFSNYELPKSYLHITTRGYTVNLDSDFAYVDNQRIKLNGDLNYGNGPWVDLSFITDKLYFKDMLALSQAIMNTYNVKNNIDELVANGYFQSDLNFKTNFKKLDSKGYINIENGNISNKKFGNLVANINGLLEFDKRQLNIKDTRAIVNEGNFKFNGNIDEKSNIDINFDLEKMPMTGVLQKFAPREVRESYNIQNGLFTLKGNVNGKLSKPLCDLKIIFDNFLVKDLKNNIFYSNKNNEITLRTDFKDIEGNIVNNGFVIDIPATNSKIKNDNLKVNIGQENITIEPSNLLLNNQSLLGFMGEITKYRQEPNILLDVFGALNTSDINKFLGPQNAVFMASKGVLPLRIFIRGNEKAQNVTFQMLADKDNYYTPINIQSALNKTTLTQANIKMQNGALNIKNTGLYFKNNNEKLTSDYELNAQGATPIIETQGTIIGLNTSHPVVNIIKITAPKDLNINLAPFKKSSANLSLRAFVYGSLENIKTSGKIKISNLNIPEIQTTLKEGSVNLDKTVISLVVDKLLLGKSDINLNTKWNFQETPIHLHNLLLTSNFIDLDNLMVIANDLNKYITPSGASISSSNSQEPVDVPVYLSSGKMFLKKIKTGNIIVNNTRANLTLKNNLLSISKLYAQIFKGSVSGNVGVNLANNKIGIDMKGNNLDVATAMKDAAGVQDAITGTASFDTTLSISGTTYEEQVKALKGTINFEVKNGGYGPFGKLENLILAENIRESQFFQTALGGVINSLATIDTARFDTLSGIINLEDGIADIEAIKSKGSVMSLFIFGNMDILKNEIDIKARGKMASNLSDMLGPIAILNPVNLIKQTPGLNLVFAQAFSLFTVTVTKEEMDELPSFSSNHTDENATSFQIVLRGDVNKPLKLIKSFKWLASNEDMERAQQFLKNIAQIQQEEQEAQERKDRFNIIKKIKDIKKSEDE